MDITYRRGTLQDTPAIFNVFTHCFNDLSRRTGTADHDNVWTDPTFVAAIWDRFQSQFEYLATTAEQYWVAEQEGQVVGYARSILENGVRELTEFFVWPACQSAGIGRELLLHAFPVEGARRRVIMATTDIRAQARYLKNGVYPRFAIQYLFRKPEPMSSQTDLVFTPATSSLQTLAALRAIDKRVVGFERDAKHEFLLQHRKAYLYYRGDQVVGYGYLGTDTGPIALLHESDYPAVLAHAENDAAERGDEIFGMQVPLINRAAVDYLLARKFQLEGFVLLFMSDEPFGQFENYIICSPPFFL